MPSEGHPLGNLKVGDTGTWEREAHPRYTEMYAEITGDRNPLHFDESFAGRTKFGSLVCHGGIAAGTLNALVAEVLPGPGSVFLRQVRTHTRRSGEPLYGRSMPTKEPLEYPLRPDMKLNGISV